MAKRSEEFSTEDLVKVYRDLAQIPTVSRAVIGNTEDPGHVQIHSVWTQRDLERSENIKFVKNYLVQLDVVIATPPAEISDVIWDVESPSGTHRAVVRKVKDKKGDEKFYVEVWSGSNKEQNINVTALDKHGKIYEPCGHFGCLEWSSCEGQLLYVAEKKQVKSKSFFERKKQEENGSESKQEETLGEEYDFKEDWGEQYVGKGHPVLCVLDIETGIVGTMDNLPENVSPGQARWCPGETGIVCVGWYHEPYRLGIIYCPVRRSALFHIDFQSASCNIISSSNQSVRSPVFSPDYTKLVYLENQEGGPHFQCSKLMMYDWETKSISTLIDIVHKAPAEEFQGVYVLELSGRCWSSDSKRVILHTFWRSKKELVMVNTEDKKVSRMTNDPNVGVWTLLDVHKDMVLATCESPSTPGYLVMGKLPRAGKEATIKWHQLDKVKPEILQISWEILKIDPPEDQINKHYGAMDYECVYLEPTEKSVNEGAPLIVLPHGGPHTTFPPGFFILFSGLCRVGFKCLMINYRGSLGFGQDSVMSLPGNIGTQDVKDCQGAVEKILKEGKADRNKVVVMGGSHGGFLTTHLIGQYPDTYKAAISRNPVTNLTSLLGTSDIPDWTIVEAGEGKFDYKAGGSPELYGKLFNMSPIRYIDQVKTPIMIMLGADDRRVPPKQGEEYIRKLKARNVKCRLLSYPENCHPIVKTESEADSFINMVQWFNKFLSATENK